MGGATKGGNATASRRVLKSSASARFLAVRSRSVIGSASIDLLKQSGESLAGRIRYLERGLAPKLERGFHAACDAVAPQQRRVVYGGVERFPLAEGVEAVFLPDLCAELTAI